MQCIYCGCTEDHACMLPLAELPDTLRRGIAALARRKRVPMPETFGCSWFETDPPVCSAPACVDKYTEHLTAAPTHSKPLTP